LILAILADQTFPNYPIKVIFCNDAHSLVYKEWIKDVSLFILNDNDHRLVVSKDANDESIEINSILDTYHLLKQVISDNYNN
jgi:hypothetical protein